MMWSKLNLCHEVGNIPLHEQTLYRPVINPQDLFVLMGLKNKYGKNFYHMRINAEKSAVRDMDKNAETITLSDIYKKMGHLYNISPAELQILKEIEIETEIKYILPRTTMVELYCSLYNRGMKLIITTDMYLPQKIIEKILEKSGIRGYNKIFVSCEYGKSKRSGRLFKEVISYLEDEGILSNEVVHIGDNKVVDIVKAKEQGLKAYYVPSAINRVKSISGLDPISKIIDSHLDNSFLIGIIANILFDNPLMEYNRETIANGSWANATILIIAPMLFVFCKWFIEDCKQNNIDEIMAVYRDGYLPERIINILQRVYGEITIKRFYLNRSMMYCYYAEKENGLFEAYYDIPVSKNMTIGDFIINRVAIDNKIEDFEEIFNVFRKYGIVEKAELISNINFDLSTILNELEPYFKKHSQNVISATDKYIQNTFRNKCEYAIFDVGYRGRVNRFLSNRFKYNITGYHICAKSELQMANLDGANTKTMIQRGLDLLKTAPMCYVLLDDIVSTQMPGINKIILKNGRLQFVYERKQEYSKEIELIQRNVELFTKKVVNILGDDLKLLNFDIFPFFDLYTKLLRSDIARKDMELFKNMRTPNDTCIISMHEANYYKGWYKELVTKYKKNADKRNEDKVKKNKEQNTEKVEKIEENKVKKNKSENIKQFTEEIVDVSEMENSKGLYMHLLNSNSQVLRVYYKTFRKLLERLSLKAEVPQYAFEKIFGIPDIMKNQVNISLKESKEIVDQEYKVSGGARVICFGEIIEGKGLGEFIKCWNRSKSENNIIYFAESAEKDLLPCTVCSTPKFLHRNTILDSKGEKIRASNSIIKKVDSTEYLKNAKMNFSAKFSEVSEQYSYLYVYWAEQYTNSLLDYINPQTVIIWLEFYPYHEIIAEICRQRGIHTIYFELGVLPGTFTIEECGQMGRSIPAIDPLKFSALSIGKNDIEAAKRTIKYIKDKDLKRWNDDDTSQIDSLLKRLKRGRPILMFAGQNDFESGMYPYNNLAAEYHSPIFKSSLEAAIYLAKLAEENDWNFIYKPHPAMVKFNKEFSKGILSTAYILTGGDINSIVDKVDLVITILSQTAYVALLRNKPVLMLGYTQLKNKKCTYEAFNKEKIEKEIKKAFMYGYDNEQQKNFEKHVAQILKYYVYDDGSHEENPYGKNLNTMVQELGQYTREGVEANLKVKEYIKRKRHGELIWKNIMRQYNFDTNGDTFLFFPTFDNKLNRVALECINKAFEENTRIIILATDKFILKNACNYSKCVRRSVYIRYYDAICLMDYICGVKLQEKVYLISLDRPIGRKADHMIGIKNTTLENMVMSGIYGKELE